MQPQIVKSTTPERCCARCGITPKEFRKFGYRCIAYGVEYKRHIWILWTPSEE